MISDPRPFTIWLPRPLWVLMVVVVLSLAGAAGAVDDDLVDDESAANTLLPEQHSQISEATIYGWVFGDGSDTVAAREQVETLLRQKIAIVDQVCGLTDIQKQKLQLAGRGDTKRLFDRVDEIGTKVQLVKHDRDKISELAKEAHLLQRDLIKPGFSTDGSLFVKSLERLLTAEQTVKYAPLRALVRAGGLVRVRRSGAAETLEISLPSSTFADEALAHLHELPGLQVLVLDRTQVTNAGLVHLSGLTSLHALFLDHTHVTDDGLAELQGLTALHDLVLDNTEVTDAGLAHLSGLTGLKYLALKNTQVSDKGLAHLKGLSKLEWLVLDNTEVTDAGLAHLTGLTSLQSLLLRRTHVTNSGIAELKRALPRLAIHR